MNHFFKKSAIAWFFYIALIFVSMDNFYVARRFSEIGGITQGKLTLKEHFRQFVFIVEYLIAFYAVYSLLNLKKIYSIPLMLLLWVLVLIELSLHLVSNKPLNLVDIAVLNAEVGHVGEAFQEYMSHILKALAFTSFLFIPLIISRLKSKESAHFLYSLIPFLALSFIYVVTLISRGESSIVGFPKGFSYGFGAVSLKVNDALNAIQQKSTLAVLPAKNTVKINKVVMIIDESINYNEFKKLSLAKNDAILDYGRAKSGANCSAASNFILRKGTWLRDETSTNLDIRNVENIFALARKGGYKSIFLDNQGLHGDLGLKNYLDKFETSEMDIIHEVKGPGHVRDMDSLLDMKKFLENEKVFIFTNKVGAHFPYEHMVAPEFRTDDKMQNYRKALELNTVNYINKLAEMIDEETIVFYTSDHGQNLEGSQTHCSSGANISASEFDVPMMVLTKNTAIKALLQRDKALYDNKITHLEISESARNVMGFAVEGVGSLFKAEPVLSPSFCGLYGSPNKIFGINPKCQLLK